jgi:hypothetical protein
VSLMEADHSLTSPYTSQARDSVQHKNGPEAYPRSWQILMPVVMPCSAHAHYQQPSAAWQLPHAATMQLSQGVTDDCIPSVSTAVIRIRDYAACCGVLCSTGWVAQGGWRRMVWRRVVWWCSAS